MKTNKPRFPNTVIRASAGTGKTFQLSNRFLGLVFAGAQIDSILATTFTRKAAGEILDRVLFRLAEAALDREKLAELSQQIGDVLIDSGRCRRVLCDVVRQMHRLRVGTLDSFFMQIAQSFSLELGLPPGWQIADDIIDQGLQGAAIRGVLRDQSTNDVLRLMYLLTKGQAARSVSEQISLLVQDLYSYYLEAPAEAWRSLPRYKQLTSPELAEKLIALEQVPLPSNKSFTKAHDKSLQDASKEAWEDFLSKGLPAKILAGETTYYSKPITQDMLAAYEPLIQHGKAVILGQIANQTEATQALLERFDGAYQALKLSERALRFDDITRKLGAAEMANRLDEVLYRLDVRISHLLLDEFQDTSPLQWRVLRPLAKQAVGDEGGHSFFCVGDVKQAIYGWRGGVAEIFEALDEELDRLQPEYLNRSWRSSQVVIDCVNRVFKGLVDNSVMEKHAAAAQKWSGRFAEHSTERANLPGYCSMATAPQAQEGQEQGIVTLQYAADDIVRLHRQAPGHSVGVLVRRNAAVARLIYELRQRGIEASEEGGNPLTDSPAVELVLSLLTLADHPGDTIARFHLANSPVGKALGIENHRDTTAASRLSLQIRQSLLTAGYGPTIYGWTKQLAQSCDRRGLSRLLQLVELAYRYEAQTSARSDDFVDLVRQQRVQDPATADVRVMTVHQAKGLQFDIVVLPELDVGISGQPPQIVVSRPKPAADIQRVCRYVSKGLQPLLPVAFQEMFSTQERQVVEESLCVMYVAMTRAIHALHMIIAPSKHNEKTIPSTWAGLLRAVLTDGTATSPTTTLYEHGDPRWFTKAEPRVIPAATPRKEQDGPLVIRLAAPLPQAMRGLDRRSPSQMEGGPQVNLARKLRFDVSPHLDRGTLLHAWFQQIEWLDDGRPAEDVLRRIAAASEFSELNVDESLKAFNASLETPAIREVLCRSTYQQSPGAGGTCAIRATDRGERWRWRVWRERPFAIRDGNTILNGKIDRLVLLYDGDDIVAADVMDYKTDMLSANDPRALDARAEIYRPQLEAYRVATSRLCHLARDRISVRLLFVTAGCVTNL